jgi:hypothetical protein
MPENGHVVVPVAARPAAPVLVVDDSHAQRISIRAMLGPLDV